jgi:hypothetical protein
MNERESKAIDHLYAAIVAVCAVMAVSTLIIVFTGVLQ